MTDINLDNIEYRQMDDDTYLIRELFQVFGNLLVGADLPAPNREEMEKICTQIDILVDDDERKKITDFLTPLGQDVLNKLHEHFESEKRDPTVYLFALAVFRAMIQEATDEWCRRWDVIEEKLPWRDQKED